MKKIVTISVLSMTLVMSGCASNGGLMATDGGGCNTGVSSSVGALLGATAGYVLSKHGGNSVAQNNRGIAVGALLGAGLGAGICMAINAHTAQKKSALDVEQQYKAQNGTLPNQTTVQQYSTVLGSGSMVNAGNSVVVKSDVLVIEGKNDPLKTLTETLVLKDSNGKEVRTMTKNVTQTGSYGSGEFENSFSWKFPANVSKGAYTIETNLYVNGNKVANNVKSLTLV